MTRTLNAYGKKENVFKDLAPTGDDFREGLTAVISVRVPHPQFGGQTKTKLGNPEVESMINTAVGEALNKYFEENPRNTRLVLKKAMLAAEAREAARKAKDLLRKRKDVLGGGGLPGKLRDCISSKMEECELYLVEGDSAGGSAEGGRFRDFQAILPLRGKIINAYKSREDKVLANEEVQSMIQAIGSRYRGRSGDRQASLQQSHYHDRRRRRWFAHSHTAVVLLLSSDVSARGRWACLPGSATAVPRTAWQEGSLLRAERR